jgi:hypothetical protein
MHSFYTSAQWTVATGKAETTTIDLDAMRSTLLGELHFALHLTPFALPFLEGLLKYSLEATPIPRKKHALLSARYPQSPPDPSPTLAARGRKSKRCVK